MKNRMTRDMVDTFLLGFPALAVGAVILLLILASAGCSNRVIVQNVYAEPERVGVVETEDVETGENIGVQTGRVAGEAFAAPDEVVLYFGFDNADLSRSEAAKLAVLDVTKPLFIIGHACQIGTTVYNMGLGTKRAHAVYRYLVDVLGARNVRFRSVGESKPVTTDPQKYNLNRRCVVSEVDE